MTKSEFEYWASENVDMLKRRIAEEGSKLATASDYDYLVKAGELMLAGWIPEYDRVRQSQCMSWYWRRKPIGNRSRGRLFLSTDQAHRAMQMEEASKII